MLHHFSERLIMSHAGRVRRILFGVLVRGAGTPITSLHYFVSLFDEVRKEISPEYWNYIAQKLAAVERRWPTGG